MIFLKQLWFKAIQENQKGLVYLLVRLPSKSLSLFYFLIIKLRNLLYQTGIMKSSKLPAYVISVGNITVGGTGKTPFVIYLSEKLSKNSKVGILSRGYGNQRNLAADDEAFPLPDNVVRVIAQNRITGGAELIEKYATKTIILDDGFQHLRLKRDVNFVTIDATNPFGNGWVLPGGILREPLSSLNRADIFVITHSDLVTRDQLSLLESELNRYNKKVIKTIHKPQHLVKINQAQKTIELSEIRNKNAWGFCGIGNPYQFRKTLELLCNTTGFSIFPDHYYYSENDLIRIFQNAKNAEARFIITTEKDAVRLHGMKTPDDIPLYYLKINIEIIGEDDIIKIMRQFAL
jgi:tetraacyldisaccharide 4'-kinase